MKTEAGQMNVVPPVCEPIKMSEKQANDTSLL